MLCTGLFPYTFAKLTHRAGAILPIQPLCVSSSPFMQIIPPLCTSSFRHTSSMLTEYMASAERKHYARRKNVWHQQKEYMKPDKRTHGINKKNTAPMRQYHYQNFLLFHPLPTEQKIHSIKENHAHRRAQSHYLRMSAFLLHINNQYVTPQ